MLLFYRERLAEAKEYDMTKTFALPTLLTAATALAMVVALPASQARADHHMENEGEHMEGHMDDQSKTMEHMTPEERQKLEQRVDALARQMQQISREMQTIQSQIRATPR